jgi:glycosyltransferase involved in cell wall biosynthesis
LCEERERVDTEPLKILMILHMAWTRDMGGPRVSVEVADEFMQRGHTVEKFDIHDAFPRSTYLNRVFAQFLFTYRARRFVRQYGSRYDVIQAEQGNLPFSKRELRYEGLLVARSNGLTHFHEQSDLKNRTNRVRNPLRALAKRLWNSREVERSFHAADAIILINQDELEFTAGTLGFREKAYLFHNGLSRARLAAFVAQRTAPQARLDSLQLCFIGRWDVRKGSGDIPRVFRQVRQTLPSTRLLLLGTGFTEAELRAAFAPEDREQVEVVPQFRSEELPGLLRQATVGMFPSAMEGFGIGVLEQLAAGVPTVAYDVPGPREMLRQFAPPLLVEAGNADALVTSLTCLLQLSGDAYAALSARSCEIAACFQWHDIAEGMLAMYAERLGKRPRALKDEAQASLSARPGTAQVNER